MQNIFMARTEDKSFLKKNIVFFTFCIYLYLHISYICIFDSFAQKTVNEETRGIYYKPNK